MPSTRKNRVSYFYKQDIGSYYYGPGHPMKPHRLRLTHHLLLTYGMYRKMEVLRPHDATQQELERFHAHDYIEFLKRMSPDTEQEFEKQVQRFNIGRYSDCPVFEGLYDFMSSCAGASIDAATKVNHGLSDICINWSGGLHHAKKGEASGFCYINDIVLAIVELLKYHPRVLYIDIDIHHGDGVEEAFYTTDRVMTASFHKYGDFFPGSGSFADQGSKDGKYYSVNFPLKDGLDDQSFESIFKPVMAKIMEVYRPGAIVMCCGADSIAGDRLGVWNLSLKGHGMAVEFMKTFNVPLILLGGGGYTPRNVARCWSYETAIALGEQNDLDETIPFNQYHNYFGPNYKLHLTIDPTLRNQNSKQYLDKYTTLILDNLSRLQHAPSVPFQDVPPDLISQDREKAAADAADPDKRPDGERRRDHEAEFYDDEKDNDEDTGAVKQEEGNDIMKTEEELDPMEVEEEKKDPVAIQKEGDSSAFKSVVPKRNPYPSGTECEGFVPEVGKDAEARPPIEEESKSEQVGKGEEDTTMASEEATKENETQA